MGNAKWIGFLIILFITGCTREIRPSVEKVQVFDTQVETEITTSSVLKLGSSVVEKNSDKERARSRLETFMSSKAIAFSTGEFTLIADLLMPESSIYEAQKKMIQYLFSEGVAQRLISYEICSLEEELKSPKSSLNGVSKFDALVSERLDLKYPGADYSLFDYNWKVKIEKKGDEYYISEIVAWEGKQPSEDLRETSEKSKDPNKRRIPAILPELAKKDKFSMIQAAMLGVKEYYEVKYGQPQNLSDIIGCRFALGEDLLNFMMVYPYRIRDIEEKKIARKIIMQEMRYRDYQQDKGLVELAIRLHIEENGIVHLEDRIIKAHMIGLGNSVWYISKMEHTVL